MYVIAIDIGYGNLKRAAGYTGGQPKLDSWPACAMPLDEAGINVNDLECSPRREGDVIVDGQPWLVGIIPEDVCGAPEILHCDYVGSKPWRAQLLYALTHGIKTPDEIDLLVLGLPVDEWLDETLCNRPVEVVRQLLAQRDMRLPNICRISVEAQPLGAYVAADDEVQGELIERRTLVVDAGHHTLDWAYFNQSKLKPTVSGTTRYGGIAQIVAGVATRLCKTEGARPGEGHIRVAVENGGGIIVNGKRRDYRELIGEVSNEVTQRALAFMQRSLNSIKADIDDVVLTGGGAAQYRPAIERLFPRSRLHGGDGDVRANVHGLWLYGAMASTPERELHSNPDTDDDLILRGRVRVNGPLKARLLKESPRDRLRMLAALASLGLQMLDPHGYRQQ